MKAFQYLGLALIFLTACGASEPEPTPETSTNNGGKSDFWDFDDVDFADLYNSTSSVNLLAVRGRLVEEDVDDIGDPEVTPFSQISQDETTREPFEVALVVGGQREFVAELETDHEGYFDAVVDISGLGLEEGRYSMEVWYDGARVGSSWATLVAEDRAVPIVRSDVDLTYLNTDFHTASAMFELMLQPAAERETLPGMASVYRNLRGDDAIPVTFLSGSPKFFKRTLEAKMGLDGVVQDGLVLKPFKDIVATNVRELTLTEIVPELKEQIGYKLTWLLKLRLQLPASTPEVLMGDDSEADFVIYNLYYRFLTGALSVAELHDELVFLGVSASWLAQIDLLAPLVEVTPEGAPLAIYINQTEAPSTTFSVGEWTIPGVTRHHEGALPLALDLQEQGLVSTEGVEAVRRSLGER